MADPTIETSEQADNGMLWSKRVKVLVAVMFALALAIARSSAALAALEWSH